MTAPVSAMLGFESGGEWWLVDPAEAGEVLPVPALTEVPLTKSWFRGVTNIRGTLYSVTDFAAFRGGAPTTLDQRARLLLVGASPRRNANDNIALLMASTLGFRHIATFEALLDWAEHPWHGARYRDETGTHWTTLKLSPLLEAATFLDIAA